ncbi:MAG: hypothetical protein QOH88_389 [Verrucomicrobiota bacterium]|jgi:hypothetical protein
MKTNTLTAEGFESTYALLVRSEDKERNLFEGVAYLIFILSAIFTIWQVAQQPVSFTDRAGNRATSVAQAASQQPA